MKVYVKVTGLSPHLTQEHEHLLVREAMKWSSQP